MGCLEADHVLLAELALLGPSIEIPEALYRMRRHSECATVINRSARELLAWHDPKRANDRIYLPHWDRVNLEYLKSIRHIPLFLTQRLLCYGTVPVVSYWRRLLRWTGPARQRMGIQRKRSGQAYDGPRQPESKSMPTSLKLSAGQWVEVRTKEEILTTLDQNGQLEGLPFMPQMFQYCGKRFQVFKRAHKTCDTVFPVRGRKMANAVHLEIRCDGRAYGGCEAACLIFWKETWLKRLNGKESPPGSLDANSTPHLNGGCSEQDVLAGTRASGQQDEQDPAYVCQATRLPYYTTPLAWWDLRQYIEDYTSGNIGLGKLLRGFVYASYFNVSRSGIGAGRIMRWLYDRFQALCKGVPYPRKTGVIPAGQKTPHAVLNLRSGDLVRVKSYEDILATLDTDNKNRGLYFDAEAVPYCGGTYRVLSRVGRILDEKTGKLIKLKNESIILEGVYCQARYSDCRMFCPRSIYSYWREGWLERVPTTAPGN